MWGRNVTCGAGMSRVGQECDMWGRKVMCGAGMSRVGQEGHVWGRNVTCGAERSRVGQDCPNVGRGGRRGHEGTADAGGIWGHRGAPPAAVPTP